MAGKQQYSPHITYHITKLETCIVEATSRNNNRISAKYKHKYNDYQTCDSLVTEQRSAAHKCNSNKNDSNDCNIRQSAKLSYDMEPQILLQEVVTFMPVPFTKQ